MSFATSLRRNLAYLALGIKLRLQGKTALVSDIIIGPSLNFWIEAVFWFGCFAISGKTLIGGFSLEQYLAYLLWLPLQVSGANRRFEFGLISDINSGAVNAMLVRPGSFFGLHLGQYLSSKLLVIAAALPVLAFTTWAFDLPIIVERVPAALAMGFCYLFFSYILTFTVCSFAFVFDHVYSLNFTKIMLLWFFTGELFPLDLLPAWLTNIMIKLPFAAGAYIPAGYLTGRLDSAEFTTSFLSLALGFPVIALLARLNWQRGLKRYTGIGA